MQKNLLQLHIKDYVSKRHLKQEMLCRQFVMKSLKSIQNLKTYLYPTAHIVEVCARSFIRVDTIKGIKAVTVMDNKEHTLLLILGRTASGKDFLVNRLCERTRLKQLTSYTTRERRVNEGDTHIFITEEEYQQLQNEGRIATFTQIGKVKYCCTTEQLYEADVYIIDYDGLRRLRDLKLPGLRFVTIFINTPDEIRERRALSQRGDDRDKFRERNIAERDQFRAMLKNADFDYAVSNIDSANAFSVLKWIATVEGVWKNHKEDTTE